MTVFSPEWNALKREAELAAEQCLQASNRGAIRIRQPERSLFARTKNLVDLPTLRCCQVKQLGSRIQELANCYHWTSVFSRRAGKGASWTGGLALTQAPPTPGRLKRRELLTERAIIAEAPSGHSSARSVHFLGSPHETEKSCAKSHPNGRILAFALSDVSTWLTTVLSPALYFLLCPVEAYPSLASGTVR